MKKLLFILCSIILTLNLNAQSIILQTGSKGVSKGNDQFSGFQATFSYDQIESVTITGTERGTFSVLSIAGAIPAGEIGTPELPVFKKFIAVPVGATPKVVVKNYTTAEYNLNEYGIHTVCPVQPDVPKNKKLEDAPFVYDTKAYTKNAYTNSVIAEVEVLGTMRGVIIGMLIVHPVQYNPAANTVMTYNNIEVEVTFENGDYAKTQEMYVNTYTPYFEQNYKVIFNRNLFDDHPDLYNTPVRMLVIAGQMFRTSPSLASWIEWKTKKGFYMDVHYTDEPEVGTTYTSIKTFCQNKYNAGAGNGTAPTFVIIVGDIQQVPASKTGTGEQGNKGSDLYYGSIDGDYFPEMYYSRLSAQTEQQLANQVEKILYYEKYQFADPTYLDNVLLIAGADGSWNPAAGQPTINYATNYYYNAAHGYANVYKYLSSYSGCYNNLNTGVGFANYTAHGGVTEWSDPVFSVTNANALTNTNKYFIAMGNCCLAADFNSDVCLGEAMMRGQQKGAVGYIGSCPLTYWHDDLHFATGAYYGSFGPGNPANPTLANTQDGLYDLSFRDADFNCLSSFVFIGNLNVTYAIVTSGYTGDTQPIYYWEAYHVLGDGSLMPYNSQAADNTVSHLPVIYIGLPTYEVTADPGSYVAISKDGELLGVAVADANGVATVTLNPPITSGGDVDIVVTRNQRKPYIVQVPAVAQSGSYVTAIMALSAENAPYSGATVSFDLTLKNVGIATATGISINITTESNDVILINDAAELATLAANAEETLSQIFSAKIKNYVQDGTPIMLNLNIISDNNQFQKTIKITVLAPKLKFADIVVTKTTGTGNIEPGDEVKVDFEVANIGHDAIANVFSTAFSFFSGFELFENEQTIAQINAGESQHVTFNGKVGNEVVNGSLIPIHFYAFKGTYTTEATGYVVVGSVMEDFETGDFLKFNWVQGANPWQITNSNVYQGTYSARSGNIGNNAVSQLKMTTYAPFASTVSYARRVSSENNYDWFNFYIDDTQKEHISGTSGTWGTASFPVEAGTHTYMFEYSKDVNQTAGSDCAWIDNITIPGMGVMVTEDLPKITVIDYSVEGLIDNLFVGEAEITFDIKNIGVANAANVIAELSCNQPDFNISTNQELPFSLNVNEDKSVMFNLAYSANTDIAYIELVFKISIEEKGIVVYYPVVLMCRMLPLPCVAPINLSVVLDNATTILAWENSENMAGTLLGYNVFRDGTKLNEELLTEKTYSDENLPIGTYSYQVNAVYEHCESDKTELVEATIIDNIDDFQTPSFNIFPNPAHNELNLSGSITPSSVCIYNSTGQLMYETNQCAATMNISVANLPTGMYFIKIVYEYGNVIKKVIVEK